MCALLRFMLRLPPMANIGVVDDRSPRMGEILNLLTRSNLLYRVVPAPDSRLDLTLQLGTTDFPTAVPAIRTHSPLSFRQSLETTSAWSASTGRTR
jgi:hypothetical protein